MIEADELRPREEKSYYKWELIDLLNREIAKHSEAFEVSDPELKRLQGLLEFILQTLDDADENSITMVKTYIMAHVRGENGLDLEIAMDQITGPNPIIVIRTEQDVQQLIERFSDIARHLMVKELSEADKLVLEICGGELTREEKRLTNTISESTKEIIRNIATAIRSLHAAKEIMRGSTADPKQRKLMLKQMTRLLRQLECIHPDDMNEDTYMAVSSLIGQTRVHFTQGIS